MQPAKKRKISDVESAVNAVNGAGSLQNARNFAPPPPGVDIIKHEPGYPDTPFGQYNNSLSLSLFLFLLSSLFRYLPAAVSHVYCRLVPPIFRYKTECPKTA